MGLAGCRRNPWPRKPCHTFTLAPAGDVTLFTLHHSGLPDSETATSHEGGWTAVLARLARQFPDGIQPDQ